MDGFIQMYTVQQIPGRFWFMLPAWQLCFEETPVKIFSASKQQADDFAALLNTAWNLGYASGYIMGTSTSTVFDDADRLKTPK